MDINEKNQLLLTQLVFMFQTAALQHMGKLKNPLTDTIERDLSQAQISIDMIEMIHGKMKGNLTAEEEKLISVVLQELRLNYVDESMKKEPDPPEATSTGPPPDAGRKP